MTIKTPHGIQMTVSLLVTALMRAGSSTQLFSFDVPVVSHMHVSQFSEKKAMAGTGSHEFSGALTLHVISNRGRYSLVVFVHDLYLCDLAVFGFNFGHTKYTPAERMGESQTEYTLWISESVIRAMSTSGLFSSHAMVLTSGNRDGSISQVLSYNIPAVSLNCHANQPATGSTIITIFGQNYGQASFTASQKFQYSSAQRTDWDSDSSISALPSDGLAASIRLILSAGIRIGTRTRAFTYNIPQLRVVSERTNFPAEYYSAISITFLGSSFGVFHQTIMVRVGNTNSESTVWISDTSMVASCGTGVFATEGFTVTSAVARVATRTEV